MIFIYSKREFITQDNYRKYWELLKWCKRFEELRARRNREESEKNFKEFIRSDEDEFWFIPSYKFLKLCKKENGCYILTMNLENEKELLGYRGDRGLHILKREEYKYEPKEENETQTTH